MKFSRRLFKQTVDRLASAGGGAIGSAAPEVVLWLKSLHEVPDDFVRFFKHHSPKQDIWAGAGAIFDEHVIMRRNIEFPRPLQAGLFILGTAPNGDLIVLDLQNSPGAIGYLMHEKMYSVEDVRSLFVPVSDSIGEFLSDINDDASKLPDDYFKAIALQQRSTE